MLAEVILVSSPGIVPGPERERQTTVQVVRSGLHYFAIVFGVGFVLGAIRTQWVVPRVGARRAEFMEMPIMLVVTIAAGRWVVLRLALPSLLSVRIGMGASR